MVLVTNWLQETSLSGTRPAPGMRPGTYRFDFLVFHEHVFLVYSFEGGGVALPEYPSRERCAVEVTDSGNAAGRKKWRSRLRVA